MASLSCSIFTLPVELITSILDELDFRALLVCKRLCRFFHTLIEGTASLRYIVELAVAGQDDRPSCASAAARLDNLRKHQTAWNELKWSQDHRIPMLSGGIWELYGGVLAEKEPDGSVIFRQLPSHYRSIEGRDWSVKGFGFAIRDLGIDPSQDLLVLIESPRWSGSNADHTHRLHLCTMSTGESHPLASKPAVLSHLQQFQDLAASYTIQVSADHVGVLFNSVDAGENELVIWNWKSGHIEVCLIGDHMRSFAFLTERHIIIALLNVTHIFQDEYDTEPHLLTLDFKAESSEQLVVDDAQHICRFSYPRLDAGVTLLEFTIRSDPSPTWKPSSELPAPFCTSRDNRLYVVTLWIQVMHEEQCIDLYAPLSTFVSHLNSLGPDASRCALDWETWGPDGTRMVMPPQPHSNVWVCYVFGSKYVASELYGHTSELHFAVHVYDFNQLALKQAVPDGWDFGDPDFSSPSLENAPDDQTLFVTTPTVFEPHQIFEDVVQTSLPYRVRAFPLDSVSFFHCAVMCSEDSLIIVDPSLDHRDYRILTF